MLTEQAIKATVLAQLESRQLGHNFVGTEQILLGTIGVENSVAAKVLKSMGVTLEQARIEVEKVIGRGSGYVAARLGPPFTSNAARALELAEEESQQLGHNYIGAEHLLLGTLRIEDGNALKVLANLGVDSTKIRDLVVRMLNENTEVTEDSTDSDSNFLEILRRARTTGRVEDWQILEAIERIRDVEQNITAVVQCLSALNANMTALRERVEQIDLKSQS